jgi:hypothetical protein
VRRAPTGRLARQRRRLAPRARRLGSDDPALSPPRLRPRRARGQRHLGSAAARPARRRRAGALQRAHQRRHRFGSDDDAQRADRVHRRRRADRHGRGRGRAAVAPRPRRTAGGAAGIPGGPRRGDGAPACAQCAADASGSDRRRRGARRRGAGHAQRDDQRPRRLAINGPRRLARGGPSPCRDARADGRAGIAARGDPRAGRGRFGPGRAPGADGGRFTARGRRERGVRVAGGPATRELYALRDGRPTWRAPLGDRLAARLAPKAA